MTDEKCRELRQSILARHKCLSETRCLASTLERRSSNRHTKHVAFEAKHAIDELIDALICDVK